MPVPTNWGSVVYKFMMPRYLPELSPVWLLLASSSPWLRCRATGDSSSTEERPRWPYAWLFVEERRFISTPKNAKGAQQDIDHDLRKVSTALPKPQYITYMPQTAIIIVAPFNDCTNGAMIIDDANIQ